MPPAERTFRYGTVIATGRSDAAKVAFVVPARNEAERIGTCLGAITACAHRHSQRVETIVVDNGSGDKTVELARQAGATVLRHPHATISAMRNIGARSTDARYVAFVDADVTVDPDWLEHALAAIEPTDVVMVGASPSIPVQSSWVARAWHVQVRVRPRFGERDWLASMNVLVSRTAFLSVGGFDESLLTCEDVDLGYRLHGAGRIVNDARIGAVHHGEAETLPALFRKESWRGSSNYAAAKRHGLTFAELPSLVHPPATLAGMLLFVAGAASGSVGLAAFGLVLAAMWPLAQSLRIAFRAGSLATWPSQFVVWVVYAAARAHSLVREASSALRGVRSAGRADPAP